MIKKMKKNIKTNTRHIGLDELQYRAFVCYSHDDVGLAQGLLTALRDRNLCVLWDGDITPGAPFSDAIKAMIMRSHLFVPLITKSSNKKPWVHQETGYAIAQGVPVLPIAVANALPKGIPQQLHAILVKPDLSDLKERLAEVNFDQVIMPPVPAATMVQVALWPEQRARLLADNCQRIVQHGFRAGVRQCGAYSSFCLPDRDIEDEIWRIREGNDQRSAYYRYLLREERRGLEVHARHAGCRLILDLDVEFKQFKKKLAKAAREARLKTLLDFLQAEYFQSAPAGHLQVAVSSKAHDKNLTIVGDWFVAESRLPGVGGYRQTVFNWHAPSARRAARAFDDEFDEILENQGIAPGDSVRVAIKEIKKRLRRA